MKTETQRELIKYLLSFIRMNSILIGMQLGTNRKCILFILCQKDSCETQCNSHLSRIPYACEAKHLENILKKKQKRHLEPK